MKPSERGDRTEAVVLAALAKAGYTILIPFGVARYDMAIDARDGSGIKTVQCKTGRLYKGCVIFRAHSVDRTSQARQHYYGQADYFGIWCPEFSDVTYLVPVDDVGESAVALRVTPVKNGQVKGIRWARDYEMKNVGMEEVRSSSLRSST
jgi:PD-(D/E)XK endonuclease